jgi:hypothetical protein
MRAFLIAVGLAAAGLTLHSQSDAVFRVDFSNPGLVPSNWTLEVHPDGSGHFHSVNKLETPGQRSIIPPGLDRDVHLGPKFTEHLFEVPRRHHFFESGCESHLKVAFQGLKKLSYTGPDGQGSCEFNFSKDVDIQATGDSLVAVATTIIEGARLEMLLQHDRLGLDQEMQTMLDAIGDGRAQQILCIHEILERLSEDPAVLERVRKRARALLARAND